jgi:hypothetical protein
LCLLRCGLQCLEYDSLELDVLSIWWMEFDLM